MGTISLQMIDKKVSSLWWKEIVHYFVKVGDCFEIRCWKEEITEIKQASLYGSTNDDKNEVSVKGIVSEELLNELLSENPSDKSLYNKMTKYFTINIENEKCNFCSAHYGTELYLMNVSDEDFKFFEKVMKLYSDCFSIHIEKEYEE